jgi:uncharacterized membrane protein YbhN (UPF0104 family)
MSTDNDAKRNARKRLVRVVQIVVTIAVFTYLFATTDIPRVAQAFRQAPLYCVPGAIAAMLVLLGAAAVRWRLLFAAYGAAHPPPLGHLYKLQTIGLFYNLLPGAIGGDVVRGVVSRDAFGERGLSAGLAIVLVERVLGLIGLILLVLLVLALHPIPALHMPRVFLWLGLAAGFAAIAGLAVGRRLAPYLPGKLRELAANLPELTNPAMFIAAAISSVGNQAIVGVIGHITVGPLAPQVHLLDSLVLAPISFAAVFFPFTVAGAGTRDLAMIALYGLLGVPQSMALLASIEILIAYLAVAALGGVLANAGPLAPGSQPKASDITRS